MITCVRGFMTSKRHLTPEAAIKRFRENCAKKGVLVKAVIHASPIGDNVVSITANIEIEGE